MARNQKVKISSENLKNDYEKLIIIRNKLKNEISKLQENVNKNVEQKINIPTNILEKEDSKTLKVNKNILDDLSNCLECNESLDKLIFSNEQIKYLPISETETETDVLFKKLYRADCVAYDRTAFQIAIIVNENAKVEIVQSINLKVVNEKEGLEMSEGLSKLKKAKNLSFLFAAITQYSILSAHRENTLNKLPQEYVDIEPQENGFYVLKVRSGKRDYFVCEWSISWTPTIHNFMHGFEITVIYDDAEFYEAISPILTALCEITSTVSDAKQKLSLWKDIFVIIKQHDSKDLEL